MSIAQPTMIKKIKASPRPAAAAAAPLIQDMRASTSSQGDEPKNIIEIIQNRFFFISAQSPPKYDENSFYFCTDKDLYYEPFIKEFGPLNLSQIYRYVIHVDKVLKEKQFSNSILYHYTSYQDNTLRTNAVLLICCYQMLVLKRTAEQSWEPFINISPPLQPYKDVHNYPYDMTVLDCLKGLEKAISLGWFSLENFNLVQYTNMYLFENGDMNWIIPNKFLAFSNPYATQYDKANRRRCTVEDIIPKFQQLGIERIVRLNSEEYDANKFVESGISHTDLYFADGSAPSDEVVLKFLKISEETKGKIAVHCKAGLGRTGTLIACYAMKHFKFPARAFIGWIRLCRPGSIHGPQNTFLNEKQPWLFRMSIGSRQRTFSIGQARPIVSIKKQPNFPNIQNTPELPIKFRPNPIIEQSLPDIQFPRKNQFKIVSASQSRASSEQKRTLKSKPIPNFVFIQQLMSEKQQQQQQQ
ncbi:hypothetical protein ABPG74_015771 [Tetrahymena malaccensis]